MAEGNLRATGLRCEYLTDPLGIDVARPRLSWTLESGRRGERQSAYRILVASDRARLLAGEGDLWDSGHVASGQSTHVVYGGPALASRQRCWWSVRVWDRDGRASASSAPAWWETGLLRSDDWQADWIGLDAGDRDTRPPAAPTKQGLKLSLEPAMNFATCFIRSTPIHRSSWRRISFRSPSEPRGLRTGPSSALASGA
ncbi:MAG: hypothetical protein M3Q10_01575, partial [Chloroflexota bacterium]|nr:hypothetical protein [Chloroflexota bacterium]